MLTDLHCHMLPGIDDGSTNVAQSIDMARIAVADGIGTTILTPHHLNGVYVRQSGRADRLGEGSESSHEQPEGGLFL